jgi:hypothetical protein
MSEPLPAPAFNLTYNVPPTDIGSGYAAGIEQVGGNRKSSRSAARIKPARSFLVEQTSVARDKNPMSIV